MPTNHSISSATLRPSYRIPHIRAAATSVNPCTGARSATSHGTSVAADLPGCWSSPGAQNTGIRGRLPVGRPGLASLQCRPANNRFEGYRDSNPRSPAKRPSRCRVRPLRLLRCRERQQPSFASETRVRIRPPPPPVLTSELRGSSRIGPLAPGVCWTEPEIGCAPTDLW
jgi:hypothetical protein